jgi:hypothetical protein
MRRQGRIHAHLHAVPARGDSVHRVNYRRSVAALSHPNIVAIHDFGRHDGVTDAVMELLEGQSLRQALANGGLPRRKALEYATQIGRALDAAHALGSPSSPTDEADGSPHVRHDRRQRIPRPAPVPHFRFAGAAPADLERAYAAMIQWFERHLGSAAK